MYFVALVALLAWQDTAPRIMAPFDNERACVRKADDANREHADALKASEEGFRFVCLKVVMST